MIKQGYQRGLLCGIILLLIAMASCGEAPRPEPSHLKTEDDYIKPLPGPSDTIAATTAAKGEVLIGYSDCATCHKEDQRSVGPAFQDIAKRYPVQDVYIKYLAEKIRKGGSRSWGYAVMTPHETLTTAEAALMAAYILSLRQRP
ncbi:c-type cytochrome [Niabella insulamsoli]|uniref:c-type cytochrome n=1 Tax=Niabella insulamsoli TaxID=3144874 RepID=UPI0031FC2F36